MGRPFPPMNRERCHCGLEMAYMPLGKMCMAHGYQPPLARRLAKMMVAVFGFWLVFAVVMWFVL